MNRYARMWLGYLIMVAGLALLTGPFIIAGYQDSAQESAVLTFQEERSERIQAYEESDITEKLPEETEESEQKALVPYKFHADISFGASAERQDVIASRRSLAETAAAASEDGQMYAVSAETLFIACRSLHNAVSRTSSALIARAGQLAVQVMDFLRNKPEPAENEKEPLHPEDPFYMAAVQYNQELASGAVYAIRSRADCETFALDARDYGLSENVIGTLYIPRMSVELPVYLGASEANMAKGVAVFGCTSVPLGLSDENTAIAGHRGWNATDVFRNIQLLQIGDSIYLTTLWDTLEYQVFAIEIVEPDNTAWTSVQPGKTWLTLMTCHPYGQNYQRYIVYAELIGREIPDDETISESLAATYDPNPRAVTVVDKFGSRTQQTVSSEVIVPDQNELTAAWNSIWGDESGTISSSVQQETEEAETNFEDMEEASDGEEVIASDADPEDGEQASAPVDAELNFPAAESQYFSRQDAESAELYHSAQQTDAMDAGAAWSSLMIFAEDHMKTAAVVMAVFVAAAGVCLTIYTVHGVREDKKRSRNHDAEGTVSADH